MRGVGDMEGVDQGFVGVQPTSGDGFSGEGGDVIDTVENGVADFGPVGIGPFTPEQGGDAGDVRGGH